MMRWGIVPGRKACITLSFLAAVVASSAVARSEALSVAEFNTKVEQWRSARKDPPSVRFDVEGRASRLGPRSLRLKECVLPIELEVDVPPATRRNANVQATGVVVRD